MSVAATVERGEMRLVLTREDTKVSDFGNCRGEFEAKDET